MQEPNPIPTRSDFLMEQWRKLNDDRFGGRLQEPPEVDWVGGISFRPIRPAGWCDRYARASLLEPFTAKALLQATRLGS